MKTDDRNPATWFQQGWHLFQHFTQCTDFIIYFDAQSLKYLCKPPVGIPFCQVSDSLFESTDCAKRRFVP